MTDSILEQAPSFNENIPSLFSISIILLEIDLIVPNPLIKVDGFKQLKSFEKLN